MTKEDFMELIEGFENVPFSITVNCREYSPLNFIKALTDSVKVEFNGKPAVYQYSKIESFSFCDDISLNDKINNVSYEDNSWSEDYNTAKQVISYNNLKFLNRREEIKKKVKDTNISKDWSRVDSMLNDAKKNHSINIKKSQIVSECNSIIKKNDCKEIRIFLGMVYVEAKDFKNAFTEFINGMDFYNAAFCAQMNNDEKAVMSCLHNFLETSISYDADSLSTLFFLWIKYNACEQAIKMVKSFDWEKMDSLFIDIIYFGLLLIYHGYDSSFRNLFPKKEKRTENIINITGKLVRLSNYRDKIDADGNFSLSATGDIYNLSEISKKEVYEGTITNFFRIGSNGYGYIKYGTESVYFNIRQVEDEHLQKLLWNNILKKSKVTFTFGTGKNEQKNADHIKCDEDVSMLKKVSEGVLIEFGNYDRFGVRCGLINHDGQTYLMREEAIIDPIFNAYIENVFSIRETYVKFIWKKHNQNRIVLKAWLDNQKETDIFNEYRTKVNQDSYSKFGDEINILENIDNIECPFVYMELPLWKDDTVPRKEKNDNIETPLFVAENKPEKNYGIEKLLKDGTDYKQNRNLENAEKCFTSVLKLDAKKEQLNTAVSNLITIYQEESRLNDAFDILNKYKSIFEKGKYNNRLIDLLEKSKQYDEEIKILNEIIPDARKSKAHRIKQLIQCYIKLNDASNTYNTLKKYKQCIDNFSYNSLYISYLDIIGDFDSTEKFLNQIISSTHRVEYKLNYMNRLALLYQKNKDLQKAIELYKQWKKFYVSNRINITTSTAVAGISNMETIVDRNLCVLYYTLEEKDKAKNIAVDLLRKNSEDVVANQILNDTYVSFQHKNDILEEDDDEFSLRSNESISDSTYVKWMLENVDYENFLYGRSMLKNIENNTKYIGDVVQAKKDFQETLDYAEKRSFAEKSNIYAALAKLIDNGLVKIDDDYFNKKKLNELLGKSLLMKADNDIKSAIQNRDSSRYFYFLSLRYLSRSNDTNSYYRSLNMLLYSFFLSDNEWTKYIDKINTKSLADLPEYNVSVLAVKELTFYTFELYIQYRKSKVNRIIRAIIDSIYENEKLRENVTEILLRFFPNQIEYTTSDQFFAMWIDAKDKYNGLRKNLKDNINDSVQRIHEPQKLNICIEKIGQSQSDKILNDTDKKYLTQVSTILKRYSEFHKLTIIEDREDRLEKIISECNNLEKYISETPTDFSYEVLLNAVTELKNDASNLLCELYRNSRPSLRVYPNNTVFYQDEHTYKATISIYVENIGNVQKADISNIILTFKNNHMRIIGNPEHIFSTVHGNQKEEYSVMISFTDEEKSRELFDVDFGFKFSYYNDSMESVTEDYRDTFQINLLNIKSFKPIDNPYEKLAEGGPVENDDMFYGRNTDINNILQSLNQGDGKVLSHRGIYIYGQMRAGKSSIAAHLKNEIVKRFPAYILLDLGSVGEGIDESIENGGYEAWFKKRIIKKLKKSLKKDFPDSYKDICDLSEFEDIFDSVDDMLPNNTVMILADEFTYIYESIKKGICRDTFPHFWKALLQNHNVSAIVIGQDSMVNFKKDYKNDFGCMKPMPVSYLSEEDAKKLIDEPMQSNGKTRFDPDALDMIYELTAGSAYLINVVCHQLIRYMNNKGASKVTKTTVDSFLKNWFFNTEVNKDVSGSSNDLIFDPQLNDPSVFENSENVYNDNKTILSFIAKNCNLNHKIKISEINCTEMLSQKDNEYQKKLIDQFIERKVLLQEGEFCRIWVDLLRYYLIKEGNH